MAVATVESQLGGGEEVCQAIRSPRRIRGISAELRWLGRRMMTQAKSWTSNPSHAICTALRHEQRQTFRVPRRSIFVALQSSWPRERGHSPRLCPVVSRCRCRPSMSALDRRAWSKSAVGQCVFAPRAGIHGLPACRASYRGAWLRHCGTRKTTARRSKASACGGNNSSR